MTQQMFVPPPPLRRASTVPPVPPLLERLRLSLLAKHPEQRPQSIAEVKRLLEEAMSEEAAAQRFPGRKPDVVGRGDLHGPMLSGPPGALSGPPGALSGRPLAGLTIGLVRLTSREDGLGASCTTGLSAQGIQWTEPFGGGQAASLPYQAIVLDAGSDVEAAAAWLREKAPSVPVVVCLADVTTDRMNTLIAAGAKDIVPYPVTSDVVAKKVKRAARTR